jgi:hypothetical protein
MSFGMPDDPHLRDTSLARLLAEALSRSNSGRTEQNSACPDAEILATYAERGLTEEDTARWESHFVDCGRCQKIIAVLAASDDELTDAEVETLGKLAAAPSAAREPAVRNGPWWAVIWHRPALWRWLVPVAGMASAAGLWFALHQAPPRETLSAQKTTAEAQAPQNGVGAASAKSDENQIAQANLPPPPESAPRSDVLLRDKEAAPAKTPGTARREEAKKQEAPSNALEAPQVASPDRTANTREYDAKDNRLQSPQAAEQKAITDAFSAGSPAAPVAAPPPPAPPVREVDRAERRTLDRAAGAPAPAQLKAFAQSLTANPAAVFASPNRRALWRLGPAGRIEHSTDQGQTWQPQSSGVTADLFAGVAPSETVAWAVGRDGIILRTEDGEHWQRVAAPSATQPTPATPPPDWTSVEARDGLHATITSRDLRRFATEDGGRTWTQAQ